MASFEERLVYPGEIIPDFVVGDGNKLGSGLKVQGDSVISCLRGMLRYRGLNSNTYYVEIDRKMYIPQTGDNVVGVIEDRGSGDYYKVNIGGGKTALIAKIAFEGATKRNRPELKKGDVLYCRVALAHRHLEPELTCIAISGVKKDWSSGEAVYGELQAVPFFT